MNILENKNLAEMTTMKLGGDARYFVSVKNEAEIAKATEFAKDKNLPIFILGGGSNILVRDTGFAGLVIKNDLEGVEKVSENEMSSVFEIQAGENWDKFVRWSVSEGFGGIESMILIPGTVGALPVQNVGAYGQEIADVFVSLRALNLETGEFEELKKEDCEFSYRDSIFRNSALGKYFICSIKIKLNKKTQTRELYPAVKKYLSEIGVPPELAKTHQIMKAVEEIRQRKLPNPSETPNAGSFFKNSIIDEKKASEIREKYGEKIPLFDLNNGTYKISTGWLVEKSGLKGKLISGMRPHFENALVLTNISAKNFSDLENARKVIIDTVFDKFGITISQEPLEI